VFGPLFAPIWLAGIAICRGLHPALSTFWPSLQAVI
jgi:hypothetical protein